jgi:hypothetical protein
MKYNAEKHLDTIKTDPPAKYETDVKIATTKKTFPYQLFLKKIVNQG